MVQLPSDLLIGKNKNIVICAIYLPSNDPKINDDLGALLRLEKKFLKKNPNKKTGEISIKTNQMVFTYQHDKPETLDVSLKSDYERPGPGEAPDSVTDREKYECFVLRLPTICTFTIDLKRGGIGGEPIKDGSGLFGALCSKLDAFGAIKNSGEHWVYTNSLGDYMNGVPGIKEIFKQVENHRLPAHNQSSRPSAQAPAPVKNSRLRSHGPSGGAKADETQRAVDSIKKEMDNMDCKVKKSRKRAHSSEAGPSASFGGGVDRRQDPGNNYSLRSGGK